MKTEKDFEGLLKLFNKNKVRYCIVGAYAVAFYAEKRYTKDMDIFVEPDADNAHRIIKSLEEKDLIRTGKIIQLGYEPIRIDLMTSIEGCNFEEVWKNRAVGTYGKQKALFIGFNELVKNKKKSGRKQDSVDISILMRKKKA